MRHILVALSFMFIVAETSATVAPAQGIEVVDLDEVYKKKASEVVKKVMPLISSSHKVVPVDTLGTEFKIILSATKPNPFNLSVSAAQAELIFDFFDKNKAKTENKPYIWLRGLFQNKNDIEERKFKLNKDNKLECAGIGEKGTNDLDVNAKLKELIQSWFNGAKISGPGKVVDGYIEFSKQSGNFLEVYLLDYLRAKLIGDIVQKDPPGKDKYFYKKDSRFSYKALFKVSKASDGKIALTFLESYQDGFVAGVKGVKKTGYSIQNGTYDFEVLNDPTKYQYTYVKSYWYPPASQRVIASKKQVGSELKENIAAQILALRDRAKSDPAAKVVLDAMGSGTDDGTSYKIHIKSDQAGTLSIVNVEKAVAQKA